MSLSSISSAGSFSSMPQGELAIPSRGEEWIPLRAREWARLKQKISSLKKHRRQWSGLGWALLGIGASAGLSWLPYLEAEKVGEGVAIATIVVAVAATASGLLALLFARETAKSIDTAVDETKTLMWDMEAHLDEPMKKQIKDLAETILA